MFPFLEPTTWVDSNHPRVVDAAVRIVRGARSDRERAIRLHDFVRDEIRFGWTRSLHRMRASDVLEAGVGYGVTKSTLLVALLRAVGIAARQRFVDVSAQLVAGILRTRRPYVDHCVTEVRLDREWQRIDSYVVDLPLYRAAQARLERAGAIFGFGVHRHGTPIWTGEGDAFAQWVDDGAVSDLTTVDHGAYADAPEFYASGRGNDRLGGVRVLTSRISAAVATARAQRMRTRPVGLHPPAFATGGATAGASGSPS